GEHAHTGRKKKKEAIKAQQDGRVPAQFEEETKQNMQTVPDGFYPAIPIPQGYKTFQGSDLNDHGYNSNYNTSGFAPAPPMTSGGLTPGQEYPPPQYPGPASNSPFSPVPSSNIPPKPPLPNFGSDSKVRQVVDQQGAEQDSQSAPPAYVPPPP